MANRTIAGFALLACGWSDIANAASDTFYCTPSRKEVCNYDRPCEVVPTGEFVVIIDEERNRYFRCDKPELATCSVYTMVRSGDTEKYRTYEMPGRGGFSKIGPNGDWAEAVSLAGMVIVSHGTCLTDKQLDE